MRMDLSIVIICMIMTSCTLQRSQPSENRSEVALFSDPIVSNSTSLIYMKNNTKIPETFTALEALKPLKISGVEYFEPPLELDDVYISFSKNHPNANEYIELFDQGYEIIKSNGIYINILERHNVDSIFEIQSITE